MPTCIIMLGASGSGKSTLAKELAGEFNAEIVSADFHFYSLGSGVYSFDASKLGDAHKGCLANFDKILREERSVIVDNTNAKWRDIKPYLFGALYKQYDLIIQEPHTPWKYIAEECAKYTQHSVPVEKIEEMIKNTQLTRARIRRVLDTIFDGGVKYEDHGIKVLR